MNAANDVDKLIDRFFSQPLKILNIHDVGAGSDNPQYCRADGTMDFPNKGGMRASFHYIVEKDSIRIIQGNIISGHLIKEANSYYRNNRWNGAYKGKLTCGKFEGEGDVNRSGFSTDVTMNVHRYSAKLERTTQSGGYESLSGVIDDGNWVLSGIGANSPEDRWETQFAMSGSGRSFSGTGFIHSPLLNMRRNCQLELAKIQ